MRPEVQDELVDALSVLDKREKFVIASLFVDRLSFRDTAKRMGVDARTVQRVKAKALAKLRRCANTLAAAMEPRHSRRTRKWLCFPVQTLWHKVAPKLLKQRAIASR